MSLEEIKIKKLKIHKDDRGYLFEGLRQDDSLFDGKYLFKYSLLLCRRYQPV